MRGLTAVIHGETPAASQRKEENFMTWKEDNAMPLSLLLLIRKDMIGKLRSHREASVPATINQEVQQEKKQFLQLQTGGCGVGGGGERTMQGKESEENHKTRGKAGKVP